MFFILLASFWTNFLKRLAPSLISKGNSLSINWVIPAKLAVGPLPQLGDSAQLAAADIQVVLSLCAEQEGALPEDVRSNFQCLHWFIPDSHYDIELKVGDLARAVELVHQTISNQLPIMSIVWLVCSDRLLSVSLTSCATINWNSGKLLTGSSK